MFLAYVLTHLVVSSDFYNSKDTHYCVFLIIWRNDTLGHLYIRIRTYVYVYVYVHACTYIRIRTYVYVQTYTYIRIRTYVYVHTCTYIRVRTDVYVHTCTYVRIICIEVTIWIYINLIPILLIIIGWHNSFTEVGDIAIFNRDFVIYI